jgi:hypothetical protein
MLRESERALRQVGEGFRQNAGNEKEEWYIFAFKLCVYEIFFTSFGG